MSVLVKIRLPLFMRNLGVAFGAGLYGTMLIIPFGVLNSAESGYEVNRPAMKQFDSGRALWALVRTGPLTLLSIVNLVLAWPAQPPTHYWWLSAALLALTGRVSTFSFSIPTLLTLLKLARLPRARLSHLARSWIGVNYLRNAFTLWACSPALQAVKSVV